MRVVSLAPLAVGALCLAFSDSLRADLARGFEHLRAGDVDGLRDLGAELGLAAAWMTTALMIVQALAAPIPAVVVTATNSLLFGPFLGGCLSIVSATLAALLCFALARAWGAPLVERMVARERLERVNRFLDAHGASSVLAARLMPFVPFDPVSYVAGLSRMRTWTFVWATLLGQIPAGFAYSYLAQEVASPAHLAWKVAASLVGLTLLGWIVRRVLTARNASE